MQALQSPLEKAGVEPQCPVRAVKDLHLPPLCQKDLLCEPLLLPQKLQHRQGAVLAVRVQDWLAVKWLQPPAWQTVVQRRKLAERVSVCTVDQLCPQDQSRPHKPVQYLQLWTKWAHVEQKQLKLLLCPT